MSDSRQTVALNLGSNRVTMAVFARNGKKLTLSRYATRFIEIDPTGGAPRLGQIGSLVAELSAELGVKGGQLNYSVSGQDVFIRFIKLPPITNADVDQLVKFEAQQQIPFPLDEIIWDYHLLPHTDGEQEVVLVAMKSDALNSMNDEFMGLGFETGKVDCSAISIYNAYKDSYPDEKEPVMVIDIGAKTTDILYIEAGKFFTRSVPNAGVFITSAIARDMGVDFATAEQHKIAHGMVSMTNGQMEGMDPGIAALATSIRNAMNRVVSEIKRTTSHYRAQMHGNAPVKAYLCGGSALLPYTKEFMEEGLGVPVSFFNPLHHIGIGKQVSMEAISREALLLGGVVGSALSCVERGTITVDLEPTVVGLMREAKRKLPKVIAGVAIAIVGAGVFAYTSHQGAERAAAEYVKINKTETEGKRIETLVRKNETAIKDLDEKLKEYSYLTLQRYGYVDIIKKFVDTAHSNAFWIVDFDPLIGYDMSNPTGISGTSVVKDTFAGDKNSSLVTTLPSTVEATGPAAGKPAEDQGVYVNAIRLKGYVILNKGGEKVAQDIKNKIEQEGENSLFTFKNKDGVALETKQVLMLGTEKAGATTDGVPFASSFTLVLPLKTPLPVAMAKPLNN